MKYPQIIPDILTNRLDDFIHQLDRLQGLTEWISIDIADGQFVPNKTIMPKDLIGVSIPFKVEMHLMVQNPMQYFEDCVKLGIKRVLVHQEAMNNPLPTIQAFRQQGMEVGVALKLETPLEALIPYQEQLDLMLLMAVQAGFQGSAFDPRVLLKIKEARTLLSDVKIEIDGGMNENTIGDVAALGVDFLIVGSAIAQSADVKATLANLEQIVKRSAV